MTEDGEGQGTAGAKRLNLRVTSLEMLIHPARIAEPLPPTLRIERAVNPAVAFYRFLYNTVGENWLWVDRRRWTDQKIAAAVQDPAVEIWVLSADGQPAGYAELDRRVPETVELAYFGLMPAFVGRGLGAHLLRFAIDQAWETNPKRLWVHTCSFDHPAALDLYKRCGFLVYATEDGTIADPRIEGLVPMNAAPHIPMSVSSII